jgi:uncharacterized protein with HEPN domain
MARDPRLAAHDVLREIRLLDVIVAKHSQASFELADLDLHAAAYAILSISEAVRHIPEVWQAEAPALPWHSIRAIGNRIRHEYFRLNPMMIWRVASQETADIKTAMEQLLQLHPLD